MHSKVFNFFDKIRSNQMSVFNFELKDLSWVVCRTTRKQYQYLFQVFLLIMMLEASRICTSMEIWLPLSEHLNESKLSWKCQMGRVVDLNHIKQEKARF